MSYPVAPWPGCGCRVCLSCGFTYGATVTACEDCCGTLAPFDCGPACVDAVPRCACVCRCDYSLDGYAAGEVFCGACLDNCSQDMAVPCEICGARAGFLCPCVTA